ncbi:MAG: TrkA family potassium uptake protein [Clostridia bacterium]|nr:TrkA family potassium uptake protein [Clostridia bacterium]
MKNRKKQIIVLGLGRFGASVAVHLSQMGHEVLAVDADEELVNTLAPHVTQAIQADATDEAALAEMDIASFDAAVVAIGTNSRDSILVTVLCKEAGVPLVIAKAVDELHAKVLRKVGADRVVFPEQDMGQRVARSLDAPNILDLAELSGDYRIAELLTPDKWCGRTLLEINVRRDYGLSVMGVKRGESFLPAPGADMCLQPGDVLLVLGRSKDIEAIR